MEFDDQSSSDSRPLTSMTSSSTSYDAASEEEQKLINSVLKSPHKILGEIEYQLLSENDAILTFTVLLDRELYDYAQLQTLKGTRHTVILDRSGSMTGWPIKEVKECAIQLAQTYYHKCNLKNLPINFEVIAFDTDIVVYKAPSFEELKEQVSKIQTQGGTSFSVPFKYLNDEALQDNFRQLKVLFLTDGLDNGKSKTEITTREFKQTLKSKEIQSNFSVIGIDAHEASFMRELSSFGEEQGQYDQCLGIEPQEERKQLIRSSFLNYEAGFESSDSLMVRIRSNSFILNRVSSSQSYDSSQSSQGGLVKLRSMMRLQQPSVQEFIENLRHEPISVPILSRIASEIKIESAIEVTVSDEPFPDYELAFVKYLEKINSIDIEKADQEYILSSLEENLAPFADQKTAIEITFHISLFPTHRFCGDFMC
ncbi:hypothetical protein FGO68_gene14380 [Halteria grandinella]|uniref:VWFA domain-containing protein n=1 Tax=Halteria grandinella TaxID=5974 RepID=A0A8J8T3D8_HALGN|nr:hypothetical protein FGO68_gene14380 [Halteria grandinella]